jgi:hypothetical protein
MSELVENIFGLDDIVAINSNRNKEDILKVSSSKDWSKSGMHSFEVNNQQYFLQFSEAYIFGEAEIALTGGDDKITLENNWFPRCFSQMILTIGGREVEGIHEAVGEASTLANLVMTSSSYRNGAGQLAGWIPDTSKGDNDVDNTANDANQGFYWRMKLYNTKKKFTFAFPLKNLFGFTDYAKVLYLIKIRLDLNLRDSSEIKKDIFYGAAGTTGELLLNKVELHIPYIEPSLTVEEIVHKRLESKKPIDCVFLKRSMASQTISTGATHSWSLGNFTNSVRFIMIAFKKEAASFEKNNALMTDGQVSALRIQINNMYYPVDRMQFNFRDYNVAEPYRAYVEACKTFGVESGLTLWEFINLSPCFIFDTSAQPEQLRTNGIQITLHIEKASASTFTGYALMLEDAHYTIDTGEGRMLRIN